MAPVDALAIINCINAFGSGPLPRASDDGKFYDVSGDDFVAPNDALAVINYINAFGSSEGEARNARAMLSPQPLSGGDLLALHALDIASQPKRRHSS